MADNTLLEMLMDQLDSGGGVDAISRQLGAGRDQTSQAVAGALPALLAGLGKNSSEPTGASALLGALERDHDGSVLDDVAGFLGQGAGGGAGAGILRHVFGGRQGAVESAIGSLSGLDSGKAGQLLTMLAPLVMGMLGKTQRERGLDAGGLTDLLGQERRVAEQRSPQAVDMLGRLLDSDGDGDMMDDIAKIGGGLLGGLFGGKR
jgi:hypothetical protein